MIVTDKFVFVHLPRSGGTFVADVIKKFFPSALELGRHLPRELIPQEYSHLPILGTVRNPWEFYVSLYYYAQFKDPNSVLVSWMSDNGTLGFADSIKNLANLGVDNTRLDQLIQMLPEHIDYSKTTIPNVTKEIVRGVRNTGIGYYTFRFRQMFGNTNDVFFCQLETLREDLLSFFNLIGEGTDELREHILHSEKQNSITHLHTSAYYTAGLAELIALRDAELVARFGYVFEQYPAVLHQDSNKCSEKTVCHY